LGLDKTTIIDHLDALAHRLGIQVRYECLESETAFPSGGLCRVKDKHFIIVNSETTTEEKVRTLTRALKRFDLSRIYIKPALRDLLEGPVEGDERDWQPKEEPVVAD
jgi:hypothetical protein